MQTTLNRSDDLSPLNESAKVVSQGLSRILADSFGLYLKTLNYHWNVEGSKFVAIHKLTEEHYKDMADAIDTIAERIRMLGFYAPGSYQDFQNLSNLDQASADGIQDTKLLETLERDHMKVVGTLKEVISVAEEGDDSTTADLLSERRNFHEQAAWMLRSLQK